MSIDVWPGAVEVTCLMRAGLSGARLARVSAIEDCAIEFVEAALRQPDAVLGSQDSPSSGSWVSQCAVNFARNFRRSEIRRARLEAAWSADENAVGASEPPDCQDREPGPEIEAGRPAFWILVLAAVEQLGPLQRLYLIRHHLEGESIADLAAQFRSTPHSIEQSLFRARRHVRDYLLASGLTEAEWRQWAANFAPTTPAPRPLPPVDE